MAIETSYLSVLSQIIHRARSEKEQKRIKALCLAYPDLLVYNCIDGSIYRSGKSHCKPKEK